MLTIIIAVVVIALLTAAVVLALYGRLTRHVMRTLGYDNEADLTEKPTVAPPPPVDAPDKERNLEWYTDASGLNRTGRELTVTFWPSKPFAKPRAITGMLAVSDTDPRIMLIDPDGGYHDNVNIRRKDGTINESIRRVIEDRHAMRADKFCWTIDAQRSGSNDERRPNAETEVAE